MLVNAWLVNVDWKPFASFAVYDVAERNSWFFLWDWNIKKVFTKCEVVESDGFSLGFDRREIKLYIRVKLSA